MSPADHAESDRAGSAHVCRSSFCITPVAGLGSFGDLCMAAKLISSAQHRLRWHRLFTGAAIAGLVGWVTAHGGVAAAVSLSDNAANSAYLNGSWANGSNGGTGFGAWYQGPSGSGVNQNATWGFDTESAANIFGTTATPNINTTGVAWTLWSQNGTGSDSAIPTAYRGFDYSLASGATFSISMATDAIGTQGAEGFQLQNYNPTTNYATPILEVAAFASGSYYSVSYGGYTSSTPGFSHSFNTGIKSIHDGTSTGNNGNGLTITVNLTGPSTASITLTPLASAQGSAETFTNLALNPAPINQLMLFNDNLGSSAQNAYFNNLQVSTPVPEPTALGLLVCGLAALPLIRRRGRQLLRTADSNAIDSVDNTDGGALRMISDSAALNRVLKTPAPMQRSEREWI